MEEKRTCDASCVDLLLLRFTGGYEVYGGQSAGLVKKSSIVLTTLIRASFGSSCLRFTSQPIHAPRNENTTILCLKFCLI